MSAVIEVRTYRAKPAMREPLLELLRSRAFPEGTEWLQDLEATIVPMLDDHAAVVTQDADDLWSRWPPATATAADR